MQRRDILRGTVALTVCAPAVVQSETRDEKVARLTVELAEIFTSEWGPVKVYPGSQVLIFVAEGA